MKRSPFAALLAVTLLVGGCGTFRGAADVATATAELPICRIALVEHMGGDIDRIAPELARLDRAFERILAATERNPDITLDGAISYALGVTVQADALESDWEAIQAAVRDYGPVPPQLAGCSDRVERGWEAIRGDENVTAARDWLRIYGPLARAGLLMLL